MTWRTSCLQLLFSLLLLPALLLADPPEKKLPVPDAAAITSANKLLNDVYKTDFAAAKTPDQKKALTQKLLDSAKEEKDSSRYALLAKARDLTIESGDIDNCEAALAGIESNFDLDALKLRADTYKAIVRNVRAPADRTTTAKAISKTVQAAIDADRFDIAKTLAEVGVLNASAANDPGLAKLAKTDTQSVGDAQAFYESIKPALLTLADKPSDPSANLLVGKYRCFIKSDWKNGLPMLALGTDAALKDLAVREIAGVTTPEAQSKLADDWWDAGEKLSGRPKINTQFHSAIWYQQALPALTGIQKIKIEQRVTKIAVDSLHAGVDISKIAAFLPEVWLSKEATYKVSSTLLNYTPRPYFLTGEGETHASEMANGADGFAFHTESQKGAGVLIDLGKTMIITRIEIENRKWVDYQNRAAGITVWTSNTNTGRGNLLWTSEKSAAQWTVKVPAIQARYITIGLPETVENYFHLSKVQVFGYK